MRQPPAGVPCLFTLTARDLSLHHPFYRAVFGWESHAWPTSETSSGPTVGYFLGSQLVALAQQDAAVTRDRWQVHFACRDAARAVYEVENLGGRVLSPPAAALHPAAPASPAASSFPADQHPEAAISAWVEDPTGAAFGLWQPGAGPGAAFDAGPNSICWVELTTRARDFADFYTGLFDWTVAPHPDVRGYHLLQTGRFPFGGVRPMNRQWPESTPAHWSIYVQTGQMEAAVANAEAHGGYLQVAPFRLPGSGRVCALADPGGATIYLLQQG